MYSDVVRNAITEDDSGLENKKHEKCLIVIKLPKEFTQC